MFASFPHADPVEIGAAVTIDADFFIEPDDFSIRTELVGELGEDNSYHHAHGFYADFVDLRLADAFPKGWRDRLVPMPGFTNVVALHPMDMAVSKVNATARSRLERLFGRRESDCGLKDINTLSQSSVPATSMPKNSPIKYSNSNATRMHRRIHRSHGGNSRTCDGTRITES